ncbi:glycosyltransferase family 4 protein [Alphaproteobacteria bacterium]|nr:glycosyltransferase family 4 protein [Alphaproteobacteria bacterium]
MRTVNKKLLMVMRLYTGLEGSLASGNWKPEGVPTVYNFIDHASKKYDVSLILTCKDSGKTYSSGWDKSDDQEFYFSALNLRVLALSGRNFFYKKLPRKLGMIFRDIRHLIKITVFVIREKPDLIYCDGASVTFAYCLRKLFPKTPLVLRVLGICSFLRYLPEDKRPVHLVYRLAFSGNFSMAIGTQDGTGTEFFFDKILNKNVPRHVLLNGTDEAVPLKNKSKIIPSSWLKSQEKVQTVLFVGRLEEDKGIRTFVMAMIAAMSEGGDGLRAVIVGSGSLFSEMRNITKNSSYEDKFHFTGSIAHELILGFQLITDIYVSTNVDGNLTNANLEAIAANSCMVIPKAQHEHFIDIQTSEYLSDSVLYFSVSDSEDLKDKILYLVDNPKEIKNLSKKLAENKKTFMRSWGSRMQEELKIIDNLIS